MAIYIQIKKVSEDVTTAVFSFSLADGAEGRLVLRKETGDVEPLTALHGDSPERGLFARAAHKIRAHWRAGEIPDLTSWVA